MPESHPACPGLILHSSCRVRLQPFDNIEALIKRLPVNEQAGYLALSSNCDQCLLCLCILVDILKYDIGPPRGSNILHHTLAIRTGVKFVEFQSHDKNLLS